MEAKLELEAWLELAAKVEVEDCSELEAEFAFTANEAETMADDPATLSCSLTEKYCSDIAQGVDGTGEQVRACWSNVLPTGHTKAYRSIVACPSAKVTGLQTWKTLQSLVTSA